jgi:branched-chain amino acid aminotransferase
LTILTNFNGTIGPSATVSVLDRGFLYGDSVYEVVRTYRGKLFGLQEHLDRLRQSAAYLYMTVPWSDQVIQTEIERTLAAADWFESYVRIVVSRGAESKISLQPSPELTPSLLIVLAPIDPEPILSQTGARLIIPERFRNSRKALDPAAKTGNYLNNILALLEAQQQGADDALLLNPEGEVTEATTSNFWMVRDGVVYTPADEVGILKGITRDFIFKILNQQGIPYKQTILRPMDLASASEGFLSSSVRLMMPIAQINEVVLPQCVGPITQLVWTQFLMLMEQSTT